MPGSVPRILRRDPHGQAGGEPPGGQRNDAERLEIVREEAEKNGEGEAGY